MVTPRVGRFSVPIHMGVWKHQFLVGISIFDHNYFKDCHVVKLK